MERSGTQTHVPHLDQQSTHACDSTCVWMWAYSSGASGTHMLEMPSGKEWRSQPRLCGIIDVLYFCLGHSYYKLPSANCFHSCLRAWGTISVMISSLIWKTWKGHSRKLGCLVLTAIASRVQLTWALILKDSAKEGLCFFIFLRLGPSLGCNLGHWHAMKVPSWPAGCPPERGHLCQWTWS